MSVSKKSPSESLPGRSGREVKVLLTTWLGSFFDGFDASIFVLTLFPTLAELLNTSSHARIGVTASFVLCTFLLGWAVGAALFGMVADKLGRVPTLVLTIMLYAGCTGLCATCHTWQELALCRFLVGCGIGGEISVGGVLLAECWRGRERYWATGLMTTAFAFGYLSIALSNLIFPQLGWRGLYLLGVVPALLTIFIRLQVQESPQFLAARQALEAKPRSALIARLFDGKNHGKLLCVFLLASSTVVGYWAVLSWLPAWISALLGSGASSQRSIAAMFLNTGSIVGGIGLSLLFNKFGHKLSFAVSFAGAFFSCFCLFALVKSYGLALLCCAFFAGAFAYAPFVALFIYVPDLFSIDLRATAFGISIQSARLIAAVATLVAGQIISLCGGSYATAGVCFSFVYLLGLITSLFLPTTAGSGLQHDEFGGLDVCIQPALTENVAASTICSHR